MWEGAKQTAVICTDACDPGTSQKFGWFFFAAGYPKVNVEEEGRRGQCW